jgi:hypothetical protein
MKIVINQCYGGFGLSNKAKLRYRELSGSDFDKWGCDRDDPALVKVVEELGEKANGEHANLKVVEIPDDVDWCVEEYDGSEWIAEVHRTWH